MILAIAKKSRSDLCRSARKFDSESDVPTVIAHIEIDICGQSVPLFSSCLKSVFVWCDSRFCAIFLSCHFQQYQRKLGIYTIFVTIFCI